MTNWTSLGFKEAGEWYLSQSRKSGIKFQLHYFEKERVVYAFVVDDAVKYIGICDKNTTTLDDRMGRYQAMTGAGTNKRIAAEIKRCLTQGRKVKIFALKPEAPCEYRGLKVDLVKGLENPLIDELRPEWNKP